MDSECIPETLGEWQDEKTHCMGHQSHAWLNLIYLLIEFTY